MKVLIPITQFMYELETVDGKRFSLVRPYGGQCPECLRTLLGQRRRELTENTEASEDNIIEMELCDCLTRKLDVNEQSSDMVVDDLKEAEGEKRKRIEKIDLPSDWDFQIDNPQIYFLILKINEIIDYLNEKGD